METVSKIQKKRGRPRSDVAELSKKMPYNDGCPRTQMNFTYQTFCTSLLGEEKERIALSGKGDGKLRRGYQKMATEVGRLINEEIGMLADKDNPDCKNIRKTIIDAFDSGRSCNDIAIHFRNIRLGERTGNTSALHRQLLRDISTFWNAFPKTSMESIVHELELVILSIKKAKGEIIDDEIEC